ncbi:BZIP transcription factor [Colletotrichum tofieldiae]|uniref:BZIP transcription factor n=1 Tax=Colletotrichum tofieldiae TaxID=708197 RepID=A0A166QAR3_9PEZI|nr:bZIP transcription factor [Colletotrichum tofieldiae]GKT58094.1 bZIP transcription factor [Colletotrichum tofieldiae]GKT79598.1 BZIP transcription factor [Colletotrichum tofieldiae]GKT84167.1 BZIP transcription factor [Colletotrichum tofieldiae]
MAASGVSTSVSSSSHQHNSSSTFSPVTSPPATDARSVYNAASRSNSVVSTPVSAASPTASTPGAAPTPTPSGPTNASHAPHQLPAIRPNAAQPISVRPPQVLNKMSMASVISPPPITEAPKMSMTTKEWVIPPRPKPGRKPATDTPPTKRKAQNRAAQRAFRERRAARVGELEEQLDEIREGHEKAEKELKDRVHGLEMELQSFKSRCLVLENMLDRERKDRVKAETELEGQKRRWSEQATAPRRLPSPRRRDSQLTHHEPPTPSVGHSNQPFSISQIVSPQDSTHMEDSPAPFGCGSCGPDGCACANDILTDTVTGCGNCTLGGRCACLEETIKSAIISDLKRAPSPSAVTSNQKRHRAEPTPPEETEIDFTAMFSKKAPVQQPVTSSLIQPQPQLPSVSFKDSCGFCKDGSYCLCADTSMSLGPPATTDYGPPPAYSQQTQTPPPSENDAVPPPMPMEIDADGAVKLRPRPQTTQPVAPVSRGCGPKGPGSCAQCLADPKSGLFCRALSANFERSGGGSGGGCCGGAGPGGGCCKSESAPPRLPAKGRLGLSLSCAEAYQTLSSHRNFEKAADDIGSWLPKLRAAPKPGQTLPSPSRLPIEVEAASIMSVLKDFDIRFGRGQ